MRPEEITFSTKPLTMKDHMLFERVKQGSTEAVAELIARRSDPPVSLAFVEEMDATDGLAVFQRLCVSIESVTKLDALISSALKPGP